MTSWLRRTQAGIQSAPTTAVPGSALTPAPTNAGRSYRDPNAPDIRLDAESKCIYERRLPGDAYITAHITRLQEGFYDSPATHGDAIDNVRFVSIYFVFHPAETVNRFQAATITISLHDDTNGMYTDPPLDPGYRRSVHGPRRPRDKPKFLRFAPHVLYGGVSPETLDWNFNLTGSLGVSQGPASASVSPSGGMKGSYKMYQMMRIQGSTRTSRGRHFNGTGYDMEDGEIVWTLEENPLQRSGLPRELTFVMLLTKGDVENVVFDINIEPKIASWFGHYPSWWCSLLRYQPLQKDITDLDKEMGQCFTPTVPGRGFNFANLASTFNDYVSLPGTTYSLTDQAFRNQLDVPDEKNQSQPSGTQVGPQSQGQKSHPKQNAAASQPQPVQQSGRRQSNTGSSRSPPQQAPTSDEPMDYHIYLHNPRSINLHATPPPPPASAPPQTSHRENPLQAASPVRRPETTAPYRTKSPANTSMKRRSIDINYTGINKPLSPLHSLSGMRNASGGSLRRSRSRTDLRSSPLVEDSGSPSSHSSQISTPLAPVSPKPQPTTTSNRARAQSNKENLSAPVPIPQHRAPRPPSPHIEIPQDPIEYHPIPMKAPSPPRGSSNMLSPPLPSYSQSQPAISKGQRLPFEMRRNHSSSERVPRKPRARDSPSPLRKRREITPSPATNENSPEAVEEKKQQSQQAQNQGKAAAVDRGRTSEEEDTDEFLDMAVPEPSENMPSAISSARRALAQETSAPSPSASSTGRRERTALRDLSPYAYANGGLDEDWDEAKGDLKRLRQRKRMSLPVGSSAHYSYISGPELGAEDLKEADRDWEER